MHKYIHIYIYNTQNTAWKYFLKLAIYFDASNKPATMSQQKIFMYFPIEEWKGRICVTINCCFQCMLPRESFWFSVGSSVVGTLGWWSWEKQILSN